MYSQGASLIRPRNELYKLFGIFPTRTIKCKSNLCSTTYRIEVVFATREMWRKACIAKQPLQKGQGFRDICSCIYEFDKLSDRCMYCILVAIHKHSRDQTNGSAIDHFCC